MRAATPTCSCPTRILAGCVVTAGGGLSWRSSFTGTRTRCDAREYTRRRDGSMRREPRDLRGWLKATDMDLSKAIRIESSDARGICSCITCPYTGFWSDGKISAGHFLGKRQSIRYSEIGLHPQCSTCNCTGVAHSVAYSRAKIENVARAYQTYMLDRYGQQAVDALQRLNSESKTWSAQELRVMRCWYKWRFKAAIKEKGL